MQNYDQGVIFILFLWPHLTGSHNKAVSNIGNKAIDMNTEIAKQNRRKESIK